MRDLIIDCFAGGGGASVGIEMALGRHVDIAINHNPQAIRMHKTNHPDTLHLTEDIFKVDLQRYVKGRHVALMWASPDCFPAGNLIWTDKGYKNIEDVVCGDRVLTHLGNCKRVYRTIKKNDWKFCNIKIAGTEEFQATLNHPFYARKKKWVNTHKDGKALQYTDMLEPQWIKAEELTTEYRVGIPINSEAEIPEWNGTIKYTCNQYGINNSWIENSLSQYLEKKDFWWLIGRYLGDGYVSNEKQMVDICCNYDEISEIDEVIKRLEIPYTTREKNSTFSFLISSKEFCEFVSAFGIGSLNKSITPEILNLPKNLLQSFLNGYISADGSWDNSLNNPRCQITTVSRKLAYGLQQCLLKAYSRYAGLTVNKHPNSLIEGRTVNSHTAYILVFYKNETNRLQYKIEDNMAWVNVKSCNKVNDHQKSIYTLSVEDDESFTVNNVAVHNCTSHSKAKGGKPREKGLRILPWAVYKHAKAILPDVILMENVEEIQQWGPLDKQGYPIKDRKGEDYQKFITAMKSLGYVFDSRELVAADYGAPTTRKRWYAIFRRDGKPIVWPEPTHNKNGTDGLKKWEPIWKYLDLTDLGKSIFDRKKPLADKTMNRIARGLDKFVFNCPEPFIVQVNHGGDNFRGQSIHEPMPTITQKHGFGTVTPYIMQIGQTGFCVDRNRSVENPMSTVVTKNEHCLLSPVIAPFIEKSYGGNYRGAGSSMNDPIHTITTVDHNHVVAPLLIQYHSETSKSDVRGQSVDEPIMTLDTSNRYGLVAAFLTKFYNTTTGQPLWEPIHTITTSPGHFGQVSVLAISKEELLKNGVDEETAQKCTWVSQFIIEYYGSGTGQSLNDPLHTILTKDKFALVTVLGNEYVILDIFLRMLKAEPELKLGQGFPEDYIIDHDYEGKKYPVCEQVARIGNSVVPIVAEALVKANCPYLKVGERMPNMRIDDSQDQLRFA
ncbi:DNA cytosine methyltransferase [Lacrimispora sp.]|uniref:DNA cytosine methyltransferase n=1 Tax=Lacrimispora sp. TaxID=2719234 RepID=UPI003460A760